MSIWSPDGGGVAANPDGSIADCDECPCPKFTKCVGCLGRLDIFGHFGGTYTESGTVWLPEDPINNPIEYAISSGPPSVEHPCRAKPSCWRLFVWECVSHDGSGFTNVGGGPTILKTQKPRGSFHGSGPPRTCHGPYRAGWIWTDEDLRIGMPDPETPLLDYPPYYYEDCCLGGWAQTTSWWTPPLNEVYGALEKHDSIPGNIPILPANNTQFTVLVIVKFQHYYEWTNYPDNPAICLELPEEAGYAIVRVIALSCLPDCG